jgi:hypothetical protein
VPGSQIMFRGARKFHVVSGGRKSPPELEVVSSACRRIADHRAPGKNTTSRWTDVGVQATLRRTASDRVGDRTAEGRG